MASALKQVCPNCWATVPRGNAHVNVARGVWMCKKRAAPASPPAPSTESPEDQ